MENTLDTIYRSGLKLLTPLSLEKTYETIIEEATRLVHAKYGTIYLGVNGVLTKAFTNVPDMNRTIPRKNGYTYDAYKNGNAHVLSTKTTRRTHPELKNVNSVIMIPIIYNNEPMGTLTLQSEQYIRFSRKHLRALKLFGAMTSLAIRKTQSYEDQKKTLEEQQLFMSIASHEMRTPLTVIQAYSQILKKRTPKTAPESRWINSLVSESQRMTNLINELFNLHMIHSDRFTYTMKKQTLRPIILRAIDDFRTAFPGRDVSYIDSIGKKSFQIIFDQDKILQMLLNLMHNAAKFSPPGTPITITANASDTWVSVTVRDEGKGISDEDIPHIFDPYYKGRNLLKEGLGIGLYLVRQIVEKHNGTIHVHSEVGKGTCVEVRLPV